MKNTIILLLFLLFSNICITQEIKNSYTSKSNRIEKRSMAALTVWSSLNIVSGSIGWATTKEESKHFNQMNLAWNIINLGIALPSLLRKHPMNLTNEEVFIRQNKIEKILLINIGLDIAYITGGFLFKEMSKNNPDNYHRFRGFGNSLILQGGFLLAFDIIQFMVHQQHRKKGSPNLSSGLSFSNKGVGLCYNF